MKHNPRIPIAFKNVTDVEGKRTLEGAGVRFVGTFLDRFHEIVLPTHLSIIRHDPRIAYIAENGVHLRAIIRSGDSPKEDTTIELLRRFCVTLDIITVERLDYIVGKVFEGSQTIYQTDRLPFPTLPASRKKMAEKAAELAIGWLSTYYPDWQNPMAYW